MAKNKPSTIVWAMGQTQHTNGNAIVRASLHPAARARQRRRVRRRLQYLPRPRQRAGRDRCRPESGLAAGLLRGCDRCMEALRGGLGRRLRVDQEAVRIAGDDGEAGHYGIALDRRRAREKREPRPGFQSARGRLLGPCAEQPDARRRNDRGDEEARSAGGDRSVSVGHRRDDGAGAQGRRLPAAGRHAARVRGLGHGVEPLDPVARESDRPVVRIAHRSHDHVPARAEVRIRRPVDRQAGGRQVENQARQGQGRHGRARYRRYDCARSTAVAGRSGIPGSHPSGCRRTCATCTCST